MELFERNKGDISIRPRGSRISPRIDNSERREAVFADGFLGVNGIPASLEGRGTLEKWEEGTAIPRRTPRKISLACHYRLFSVLYFVVCLVVAIIWQGWIV